MGDGEFRLRVLDGNAVGDADYYFVGMADHCHCCTCGKKAMFIDGGPELSCAVKRFKGELHPVGYCKRHTPKEVLAVWARNRLG